MRAMIRRILLYTSLKIMCRLFLFFSGNQDIDGAATTLDLALKILGRDLAETGHRIIDVGCLKHIGQSGSAQLCQDLIEFPAQSLCHDILNKTDTSSGLVPFFSGRTFLDTSSGLRITFLVGRTFHLLYLQYKKKFRAQQNPSDEDMDGVYALHDRAEERATSFLAEDILLAEIHEPAHPAGGMVSAVGPRRSVVGVPLEQRGDIVMKSLLVATAGADRDERTVMRIFADHHRRWDVFDPIDVPGMTDVVVVPRQERCVQQMLHTDHIPDNARHAPEDPFIFCSI